MKSKHTLKKIAAAVTTLSLMPFVALAQNDVSNGLSSISSIFGNTQDLQDPADLIMFIIHIMLTFAGIIAVLFVIIGGYRYITAQGNEEAAQKGKTTLVNALIGVVIVILSYVIVNVIVNLVSGNGL